MVSVEVSNSRKQTHPMENKEGSASAAPPRQSGTAEGTSALSVDFIVV